MKTYTPDTYVAPSSRLKFIKRTLTKAGGSKALYLCSCGNVVEKLINKVKRGSTKSCGCYSLDNPSRYVHGLSNNPLYKIFTNIVLRCYNKNHSSYKNYGGKGVFICDKWLKNPNLFIEWALLNGWEKGMEIDKDIKCNLMGITTKYYSEETCSVVTRKENLNNKETSSYVFYLGEKKTVAEWANYFKIPDRVIDYRIKKKWDLEKVFSIPVSRHNCGARNNNLKEKLK